MELVCRSPELADKWHSLGGGPAQLATSLADTWWKVVIQGVRGGYVAVIAFSLFLAPPVILAGILSRAGGRRVRTVLDLHDYLPSLAGRRRLQAVARHFDCIVAVSHFCASQLESSTEVKVLYRPVTAIPYKLVPKDPGSFIVGIIGRLDHDKNLIVASEAISALPRSVILSFRGEESQPGEGARALLESHASRDQRLQLEGARERQDVLAGLDCVAVTNDTEPMGRTVAEAQLSGVPVVVPDAGGASELVRHEKTGLIYQSGSALGFSESITLLMTKPALRDRMIAQAFLEATARHNPQTYAESYTAIVIGRLTPGAQA